jgi:autotransporter-associated beta strand protein
MKKNNRTKNPSTLSLKSCSQKLSSLTFSIVALSVFHVAQIHAATLIGWDIPTSTTTSAAIQGTPASGISGTAISLGTGLNFSSSSTAWRVTGLNNTTGFSTAATGANATSDYFQWSLTTSARTTAQITGSTGFLWTASGTGPSTSAELWVSTNGGTSFTQLGSAAALGASEVNVGNSWFGSAYDIAAGTTVIFRAAPLGATGGSTSPKIAWNAGASPYTGAQDVTLTGTTGGGAWNLNWNGGATGAWNYNNTAWLKDGTGSGVSFVAGDNAAISSASAIALDAAGITAGSVAVSNESGTVALTGGTLTAGSLTKSGAGNLTLANSGAYSGGVTASAGSITLDNSAALGSSSLTLNGGRVAVTNAGVTSVANAIAVGSNGGGVANDNALTLSGAITGSGNTLTKTGAGDLTLSGTLGANKAGLAVNFSEGTLNLTGGAKEFMGTSTMNGTVNSTGVALNLDGGALLTGTGNINMNGGSISTVYNGGTGSSAAIAKNISASNALALIAASGKNLEISGNITASGDLTISGSGKTKLTGTGNNLSGAISIGSGGVNVAAGGLTGSAGITNNGTLSFNDVSNATLNRVISGTGSVTNAVANDVKVTLGAVNTYTGTTSVTNGILEVASAGSIASSATTVGSSTSGTGILIANGTVGNVLNYGTLMGSGTAGAVTLYNGSFLKPGSSPGNLTATSSIWNSGATYDWQITSLTGTAGTNWDLFTVTGGLDLTNLSTVAKFNLSLDSAGALAGFSDTTDYSWTFARAVSITGITTEVGTDITNLFNIASGNFNAGVVPKNGFKVLVGDTAGGYTSLNLVATSVPEPSTPALMGMGLVALMAVRSMRRRLS